MNIQELYAFLKKQMRFRFDDNGALIVSNPLIPQLASESTLQNLYNLIDVLRASSGNIKATITESFIKVPIDVQDHLAESLTLLPSGSREAVQRQRC